MKRSILLLLIALSCTQFSCKKKQEAKIIEVKYPPNNFKADDEPIPKTIKKDSAVSLKDSIENLKNPQ